MDQELFPPTHDAMVLTPGRGGAMFDSFLRALSYAHYNWQMYHTEVEDGKEQQCVLSAICFDKLGMLFHRLWQAMYYREGPSSGTEVKDKDQLITFPSPFRERPGKHGPGPAIDRKRGAVHLIGMLHALQEENLQSYFDVQPFDDQPEHHKTRVVAVAVVGEASDILEPLCQRERAVVVDFAAAVKHLDEDEIRALGTHENADKSLEHIELEFKWMRPSLERISSDLGMNAKVSDLPKALEFASEAVRKSRSNESKYQSAREKLLREFTDPAMRKMFSEVQQPATGIWQDSRIKLAAVKAGRVAALLDYVRILERGVDTAHAGKPIAAKVESEFRGIHERLGPELQGLPSSLSGAIVVGEARIRPEVLFPICKALRAV